MQTPVQHAAEDRGAKVATEDQLRAALERRRTLEPLRLGDALVGEGLVTVRQRDAALAVQRIECHKPLGRILVEAGALACVALERTLVEQLGVPHVDLARFPIQPDALAALPARVARACHALPLCKLGIRLVVAVEDPLDLIVIKQLERAAGSGIEPVLASRDALRAALQKHYGAALTSVGDSAQQSQGFPTEGAGADA